MEDVACLGTVPLLVLHPLPALREDVLHPFEGRHHGGRVLYAAQLEDGTFLRGTPSPVLL